MGDAVALRDAAAGRAVEADRMDLVQVGHGAVVLGQVADRADRGDVAIHRIDALEGDQLRRFGRGGGLRLQVARSLCCQMTRVALAPRMPAIIEAWFLASEKTMKPAAPPAPPRCRLVGDVAGAEQQRRRLAVQRGQLGLQRRMQRRGAGDVAGAAGAGAVLGDAARGGCQHAGWLPMPR